MTQSEVRRIAREEVASLAGLVLRRLQEREALSASGEVTAAALSAIFGEALRDFGGTIEEPGGER